jgi:hypothetical protein
MSLYDLIIEALPELENSEEFGIQGSISLQNDADNFGDYIAKWEYSKPLPNGMKIGKE